MSEKLICGLCGLEIDPDATDEHLSEHAGGLLVFVGRIRPRLCCWAGEEHWLGTLLYLADDDYSPQLVQELIRAVDDMGGEPDIRQQCYIPAGMAYPAIAQAVLKGTWANYDEYLEV